MAETKAEIIEQPPVGRFGKLIISILFFGITNCWEKVSRLFGPAAPGRCTTLYYHCVLPQHRLGFARQMDMLLKRAVPVPVDYPEALEPGKRYAAVTFDDGFTSVAENGLPELIKRKIPATIFVLSDLLGQTPGWKGYPDRFMSLEELRALPADLISLGSHTRTHAFLPNLTEDEARDEIVVSRLELAKMLNRECTLFAFPYGAFNERLINICREAGYKRIFTTLPYPAELGPGEFVSGRVTVDPTDWTIEFYLKLSGAYRWLPIAFATKKKLRRIFAAGGEVKKRPLYPQSS
jgi:peptidoglycan/xylan/chitin deacetylase (PgdA/CDA1 family)